MTSQLPRRPFRALTPPPDGLDVIRREARRRRRRRATFVAAGGTGVAAVAVALVLSTASGGLAVLKPTPDTPAGGAGTTSPHPSASSQVTRHAAPPVTVPVSPTSAAHKVPRQNHEAPTAAPPARSNNVPRSQPSQAPSTRLRVYRTHGTMSGVQLCGGDFSSGQGSFGNGVGWCEAASATKVTGGERLRFTACRDDTRGGSLTYPSRREIDFAVRQNGRTIWDWGRSHPDSAGAHTRSAAANDCWNWELVWPDARQSGRPAGHGQFTFVATTTADELSGYKPETGSFRY